LSQVLKDTTPKLNQEAFHSEIASQPQGRTIWVLKMIVISGNRDIFKVMETAEVTCPTCFETFSIPLPGSDEVPCDLDYDCEICCRPLVVHCWLEDESVCADAAGLDD
jgi:hypothetical protein